MAQDNTIPLGKPGIASFESETWGNSEELLFGDTPPVATQSIQVTATGAALDLPLGAVVSYVKATGVMALAVESTGSNASYILAAPLVAAEDDVIDVPVYRAGHFRQQALTWDASFDTDAKKASAFEGSISPTILISKANYVSDDVPV